MKHKKVFVVGGAGFLGYHTCFELADRGYDVTCLAMPKEEVDPALEAKVSLLRADIDSIDNKELSDMLAGHDVLVYAAGPDDRVEIAPGIKASEFFETNLVQRTERVARAAKNQGIRKLIIFGSYFSYINNHGLAGIKIGQLAAHHPYVKARVDQTERCFNMGDEDFEVAILNIPYVFGTAPNKEPIWKHVFVDRFDAAPKIYFGNGGTTLISAKKIAYSVAQAIEHAKHGDELPVGSADMKFNPMIEQLLKAAEIDKPVGSLPNWLLRLGMKSQWKIMKKENLDSGLDLRYLADDILKREFYVDYKATDDKLQMGDYVDDVDGAIAETGERMRTKNN